MDQKEGAVPDATMARSCRWKLNTTKGRPFVDTDGEGIAIVYKTDPTYTHEGHDHELGAADDLWEMPKNDEMGKRQFGDGGV